jgi:hypothetical protein
VHPLAGPACTVLITSQGVTADPTLLNLAEVELYNAKGTKIPGTSLRANQSSLWEEQFGYYAWPENAVDGACNKEGGGTWGGDMTTSAMTAARLHSRASGSQPAPCF